MGRGGARYLRHTAVVLLSAVSTASAGLWDVSIDLSPAPAPEDGPPFSFHATRDRSLLPYQVIGVVGAYIVCVVILGSLLLTVGRRARKRAQDMANRDTELIERMSNLLDATPKVKKSESGFFQRAKSRAGSMRSARSNIGSPGGFSTTSVDEVHEQYVQQRKAELGALYDAVYGDEDRKNASVTDMQASEPPQYRRGQVLARLAIDSPHLRRVQTSDTYPQSPMSPMTPKSPVRAIHPPPMTSPTEGDFSAAPESPGPGLPRSPRDGRTASFSSHNSASSPQKTRKALRDLKISNPVQRYRGGDNSDGARTPLSPTAFETSEIAPAPPTGRTNDSQYPPTTPGTGRSFPYPEERLDAVRDLPQAYPQRIGSYQQDNQAQALTDAASQRPDPTSTIPQNKRGTANAGNINTRLPFREQWASQRPAPYIAPFPLPHSASFQASLRSPGQFPGGLKSPDIKERVLEYGGRHLLGSPLTGQPTPYSPHMPGMLVTPVSARPQTRVERKQREKEAKAARGAATDADQVADDEDLWSSGY